MFRLYAHHADALKPKTFVVLGAARGGTSMIASALKSLEIFIGERLGKGNLEDVDFRALWKPLNEEAIAKFVVRRNETHPVWAAKLPVITTHLDFAARTFRNPHYIVVVRDPVAIAVRHTKITGKTATDDQVIGINLRIQAAYRDIFSFIKQQRCPTLLVSYEKISGNPTAFCRGLADFAGIADRSRISAAVSALKTDHDTYLARASTSLK